MKYDVTLVMTHHTVIEAYDDIDLLNEVKTKYPGYEVGGFKLIKQ